jgi:hypothetical protein
MAISRAQMGSQLTGNKMKKTMKKAMGGQMAPMQGMEQMVDPNMAALAEMQRMQMPARGMKKGGKVRGDGVCQRGKTKGTMR